MDAALDLIQKQEAIFGCNESRHYEKHTLHAVSKNHERRLAKILVFNPQVRSAVFGRNTDTLYAGIKHSRKFEKVFLLIDLQL